MKSNVKILLIFLFLFCITGCIKKEEYNIFLTEHTLPTLYAALDMSEVDAKNTFIWYGISDTLDNKYLLSEGFTLSENIGTLEKNYSILFEEVNEFLKVARKNDIINLYLSEEMYFAEFDIITINNFKNFNIKYYSEGTATYENELTFSGKEGYASYIGVEQKLNDILKKNKKFNFVDYSDVFILAKRSNVEYYLQYPNYISVEDEKVVKELNKINYITDSPKNLFNNLSKTEQERFMNIVKFNKNTFDTLYFNGEKPFLIITGGTPFDYNYGEKDFKDMINQIAITYGQNYKLLFKPHPRALPDENYEKFLKKLNIEILPGKMPMEVISFVYDDLKLGGVASSLYMSANPEDIMFFMAKSEDDLFSPLNLLCESEFKNVVFIQPNKKGMN